MTVLMELDSNKTKMRQERHRYISNNDMCRPDSPCLLFAAADAPVVQGVVITAPVVQGVAVTSPVVQGVVVTNTVEQTFRESPVEMVCPYCNVRIVTAKTYHSGLLVWIIAGVLFIAGCV